MPLTTLICFYCFLVTGARWMLSRRNGIQSCHTHCASKCGTIGHSYSVFHFFGGRHDPHSRQTTSPKYCLGQWMGIVSIHCQNYSRARHYWDDPQCPGATIGPICQPIHTICVRLDCQFDLRRSGCPKRSVGHERHILIVKCRRRHSSVESRRGIRIGIAFRWICFGIPHPTVARKARRCFQDHFHRSWNAKFRSRGRSREIHWCTRYCGLARSSLGDGAFVFGESSGGYLEMARREEEQ